MDPYQDPQSRFTAAKGVRAYFSGPIPGSAKPRHCGRKFASKTCKHKPLRGEFVALWAHKRTPPAHRPKPHPAAPQHHADDEENVMGERVHRRAPRHPVPAMKGADTAAPSISGQPGAAGPTQRQPNCTLRGLLRPLSSCWFAKIASMKYTKRWEPTDLTTRSA